MKTGPASSPFNKAGSLKLPLTFEALSNQLLLKPNLHCSQGSPVWDLLNPLSTFSTAVLPNLCFPVSLADTPSIEDFFPVMLTQIRILPAMPDVTGEGNMTVSPMLMLGGVLQTFP